MPLINGSIQLNWSTPTLIVPKNTSRSFIRFFVTEEWALLGGSNLNNHNGIYVCWKNIQEFYAPASKEAFYGLGQCRIRYLECV